MILDCDFLISGGKVNIAVCMLFFSCTGHFVTRQIVIAARVQVIVTDCQAEKYSQIK